MTQTAKQQAKQERIEKLINLIVSLDNPEDCRALFEDLCTAKELENMAERCHAAGLLLEERLTIRSWRNRTSPLPP